MREGRPSGPAIGSDSPPDNNTLHYALIPSLPLPPAAGCSHLFRRTRCEDVASGRSASRRFDLNNLVCSRRDLRVLVSRKCRSGSGSVKWSAFVSRLIFSVSLFAVCRVAGRRVMEEPAECCCYEDIGVHVSRSGLSLPSVWIGGERRAFIRREREVDVVMSTYESVLGSNPAQ